MIAQDAFSGNILDVPCPDVVDPVISHDASQQQMSNIYLTMILALSHISRLGDSLLRFLCITIQIYRHDQTSQTGSSNNERENMKLV